MTDAGATQPPAANQSENYADQIGTAFKVTRSVIFLAIIGTTVSAITMMSYALIVVLKLIKNAFTHRPYSVEAAQHLGIELIEMTDLFLFGMALYVVAIGMFQLFIRPVPGLPRWLLVRDLGDLKTQLLNVIIVLLAVTFLAMAIAWTGGKDIVYLGIGIGIVIISLAAFSMTHHVITSHDRAHGGE
jgi:uncharacterized membrane protein YqhA